MATSSVCNHASIQATKLTDSLSGPSSSDLPTPVSIALHASGQGAVPFYDGSLPPLGTNVPLLLTSDTTHRTAHTEGGFGTDNGTHSCTLTPAPGYVDPVVLTCAVADGQGGSAPVDQMLVFEEVTTTNDRTLFFTCDPIHDRGLWLIAGQVRLGLRLFFNQVRVRNWWYPNLPQILARFRHGKTRRGHLSCQKWAGAAIKKQKGGPSATAIMTIADFCNSKLQCIYIWRER